VIEYASLSCPHCGHFNETIFPSLKTKYIDTGKVRYTLKEMLTEPATVAAAGFLIARCAGPEKYFAVVDQVFRSQPRWQSGNIKPIFQEIAAANGVDEEHFNACLTDQQGVAAIGARAERASEQDGSIPRRRCSSTASGSKTSPRPPKSWTPQSLRPPREATRPFVQFQRLRLSGFKSSSNRPSSDRAWRHRRGGPNGCGKSNLLEALRW